MTTTTPVPVGIVTLGGDVNDSTTHDQVDRIIHRREMECLVMLNSSTMATPVSELYCPGTFDGWSCWPDTPAGTSVQVPCPEFITGFDPSRMAHKECNPNGTWYRHPTSGHVWSNYTTCINLDDLNWRQHVNRIYEIGYFISLLALLLSLFILYHFKHFRVESARFATRDTFCARSYLPEPALRAHHAAHALVRLLRRQQRPVAAVVPPGGQPPGRHHEQRGGVPGAARDTALLPAGELRVDAVRGLLPAHLAGERLHLRVAARQVAVRAGLDRSRPHHRGVHGLEGGRPGQGYLRVLDQREQVLAGAGGARVRVHGAEPGLPVQHPARAAGEAASRPPRGLGAAFQHAAAAPARERPRRVAGGEGDAAIGPAARAQLPGDPLPAATRTLLREDLRGHIRDHRLLPGPVRCDNVLLLQRRGGGAGQAEMAAPHVPAAGELLYRNHGFGTSDNFSTAGL
ncbi:uncharacterized protein LOC134540897 isoform X10 [Bacillus rossius redtenbacheri]|uniref:uncharacterized protein LOC134540897 isoform X10 n=1 Tax=Bacillus rossius redtenbacheri TaxID=93214 RepID=UPI002FDE98DD